MTGISQVTTSIDAEAAAEHIAATLITERLAACVQIIGPVSSVYRWRGEAQRASEWLLIAKTGAERRQALMDRIRTLHTYELPEIVAVPLEGDPAYLEWVCQESLPPNREPQ